MKQMMYYYEIRNTKTQATAEANGHSFQEACATLGWKPWNCRCVYRAEVEEG